MSIQSYVLCAYIHTYIHARTHTHTRTHTHACTHIPTYVHTCSSCNTGMKALPDMYAQLPKSGGHTYQAKPKFPVLQLICSTSHPYQADSPHDHPNLCDCNHRIYYKHTYKFHYGPAASTFWLRLVMTNGQILEI